MKNIIIIPFAILSCLLFSNCRSTKKINKAIINKDSVIASASVADDSATNVAHTLKILSDNHINYQTFSAKIKVDYTDSKGKQPDVNAFVRMQKDSLIWVSLNATFLNIEAFRILINTDSIYILNKLEKVKEVRPISYLEQVIKIPLSLSTLQDLLIGNPIFTGPNIISYKQEDNRILLGTLSDLFKNLISISTESNTIENLRLEDLSIASTRTAELLYSGYESKDGQQFSTQRDITVIDKSRINIMLDFKQYEFNAPLSFPFNIPNNYKSK